MLVWILPNMSGVVTSLFDIFWGSLDGHRRTKSEEKHWRPDFTLDFSLSKVHFLDFIHVKTNIDQNLMQLEYN